MREPNDNPSFHPRIAVLVLLAYLLLSIAVPFIMPLHHHAATGGCIFMPGESALCGMTPLAHAARWSDVMAALVACAFSLLLTLGALHLVRRVRYEPPDDSVPSRFLDVAGFSPVAFLIGTTLHPRAP